MTARDWWDGPSAFAEPSTTKPIDQVRVGDRKAILGKLHDITDITVEERTVYRVSVEGGWPVVEYGPDDVLMVWEPHRKGG